MSDSAERPSLLPRNPTVGWTAYAWLIYLVILFAQPVFGRTGFVVWTLTIAGALAFLASYFFAFRPLSRGQRLAVTLFQFALGLAFTRINVGAAVLFVYAAGTAAWLEDARLAARSIAAITLAGTAVGVLGNLPIYYVITAFVIAPLIGAVNMHQATVARTTDRLRVANDEIGHLAMVAERERIARDLHDVLGHTLSLIVLKSELASRLADRDIARATAEIRDVERVARAALEEVRATVRGYRAMLPVEIAHARSLLETAAIASDIDVPAIALPHAQEEALAFAVREGITNVVRHSGARSAAIRLIAAEDEYRLEIHDDGSGGDASSEGNGLRGMRARIHALGGTVHRESGRGTRLIVTLPAVAA